MLYFNLLHGLNGKEIFSASLILFSVIDILGCIPIILKLLKRTGTIDPMRTTFVAGGAMTFFFFTGSYLLDIFGLGLDDFSLAGALVLLILGLEMVLNIEIFKIDMENLAEASIVPLGFPIIAGVGSFTTILSLQADYAMSNVFIAMLVNIFIIYLVLRHISFIERLLGRLGLKLIHKLMGIILLSIAVKLFKVHLFKI